MAGLRAVGVGVLTSAHDVSEGGLAQALVESTLRHGIGVVTTVDGDPFTALFSESAGRVVVTVRSPEAEALQNLAAEHGVVATPLGVTAADALVVDGQFEIPLDELRAAWSETLPAALG